MKEKTVATLNGFGIVLRFLTPLMVGIVMMMLLQDRDMRKEMQVDIASIKTSLDNHVMALTKEQTLIRERLGRIEGAINGVRLK